MADETKPTVEDQETRRLCASRLVVAWRLRGLANARISALSAFGKTTVYRYMTGERMVSGWSLMRLCPVLHVSADWVLGIKGGGAPYPVGSDLAPSRLEPGRQEA